MLFVLFVPKAKDSLAQQKLVKTVTMANINHRITKLQLPVLFVRLVLLSRQRRLCATNASTDSINIKMTKLLWNAKHAVLANLLLTILQHVQIAWKENFKNWLKLLHTNVNSVLQEKHLLHLQLRVQFVRRQNIKIKIQ